MKKPFDREGVNQGFEGGESVAFLIRGQLTFTGFNQAETGKGALYDIRARWS